MTLETFWSPDSEQADFYLYIFFPPFFLSDLECFSAHLQPRWLSRYSSNPRKRVEENNIQANPFINNGGWEQRVNAPNTQQKAALGTSGSSKWRCWNIKNCSGQKSCNMVSVNCKQHSDVYLPSPSVRLYTKVMKESKGLRLCSDRH